MKGKYLYIFKFKDVNIVKIGIALDYLKRKGELEFMVGRDIDMRESTVITSEYDEEINIFEKQILSDYRVLKPKSDAEFMKNKLYSTSKTEFRYAECTFEILHDILRKMDNPYLHFKTVHYDDDFIRELDSKHNAQIDEGIKSNDGSMAIELLNSTQDLRK